MRIIAIANQKGGCGKTTTAINLSYSLSLNHQHVLLIDCDPQSHATMGLNINSSELEKSMYNVMTPKQRNTLELNEVIIHLKENFDLAPSSVILSAVEQELSGVDGREERLLRAIDTLETPYDYIIIDCPPSIGLLCFNALRACREVIIPIEMSLFSLRGVAKLTELVIMLKEELNHSIVPRALITMYDSRTRYSRRVLEKVKEEFQKRVFDTIIRYNIRLRETVDYGLPVADYDKHAIGHKDYQQLAREVMSLVRERTDEEHNPLGASQSILTAAEEFFEERISPSQYPGGTHDASLNSYKSSYEKMVENIVCQCPDGSSEEEGIT